jgi:CheY-like chemotaxis protein
VAVDVESGAADGFDAVDDLADPEQATSANVIVTTSSVMPQRTTRD